MRVLRKEAAGKYLLFCLALVPTLLFAYLGHFSRLIWDDYDRLGKPIELGFWQSVQYFRDTWNGDYTNFLLFGLLAPLGAKVPSIFPSALIVIWIAGSALLYLQVFTFSGNQATALFDRHRTRVAHGCCRYQRIRFAAFVLLVNGNCRIHPAASPAIDLPDAGSKDSRASAHPFPACDCSLSRGCDRFRHCRLLGNVPGLSAGVSGAPKCRWNLSLFRDLSKRRIYFLS